MFYWRCDLQIGVCVSNVFTQSHSKNIWRNNFTTILSDSKTKTVCKVVQSISCEIISKNNYIPKTTFDSNAPESARDHSNEFHSFWLISTFERMNLRKLKWVSFHNWNQFVHLKMHVKLNLKVMERSFCECKCARGKIFFASNKNRLHANLSHFKNS